MCFQYSDTKLFGLICTLILLAYAQSYNVRSLAQTLPSLDLVQTAQTSSRIAMMMYGRRSGSEVT